MEELLEGLDWVDFERSCRGEIYVYDRSNKDLIKFCMRIGTHLDVVKKAILSRDKFIRVAVAPEWDNMKPNLVSFDPLNPDTHLYNGGWRPAWPQTQPQQSLQYLQNTPYGGSGAGTYQTNISHPWSSSIINGI